MVVFLVIDIISTSQGLIRSFTKAEEKIQKKYSTQNEHMIRNMKVERGELKAYNVT